MQDPLQHAREILWHGCVESHSHQRLHTYARQTDIDQLDALGRYHWNIALCEALYPSLQTVEVCVRNAVHDVMCTKRTASWYEWQGLLLPQESLRVEEAKDELLRHGKPLDPSRVVAELPMGFWTQLFAHPYDRSIAQPVIHARLRHLDRHLQTRAAVSRRGRGPWCSPACYPWLLLAIDRIQAPHLWKAPEPI